MSLEVLKVYQLPNGKEVVLDVGNRGNYNLCSSQLWGISRVVEYQINREGRLVSNGRPTHWGLEHLIDTGRRVVYPKKAIL